VTYKPLPNGVTIKPSKIHGLGLFAMAFLEPDTVIGTTHFDLTSEGLGLIRTPLGGFINHSKKPNAELQDIGIVKKLIITEKIYPMTEITVKYKLYKVDS
jgi:SET domain-containing protein